MLAVLLGEEVVLVEVVTTMVVLHQDQAEEEHIEVQWPVMQVAALTAFRHDTAVGR